MPAIADLLKRLPGVRHLLTIARQTEESARELRLLRELRAAEYLATRLLPQERYRDPARLARYEAKVYSQGGEDGAIAEIFRRIGTTTRSFVEFGVGSGVENNTVWLLVQGWSGCWIEGNPAFVDAIRRHCAEYLAGGRLKLRQDLVSAENVESLFAELGVPEEPDLLSIDIDGNDYWVWRALRRYRPRVITIEYNGTLPPAAAVVQRYDPHRAWDRTSYFGAGLKALELLGREKGYALVGCGLTGTNAFFVREDLCGQHFAAPFTAEHHYEPARYFLITAAGHPNGMGPYEVVPSPDREGAEPAAAPSAGRRTSA